LKRASLTGRPFSFGPFERGDSMQRIIITGANGAGKSHLAARCHAVRPNIGVVSYDALRLTSNWVKRPPKDAAAALSAAVAQDAWILEGGPSLLPVALPYADAVVWLDPPFMVRAFHLFVRPWKNRGKTRAELPDENPDRIGEQYRFAWASLKKERAFRSEITQALADAQCPVIGVTSRVDADSVVSLWAKAGKP